MRRPTVERLVRSSAAAALAALALMVASVFWPNPYLIVFVMSVGQAVGTLSFALFLFAIAMDLVRLGEGRSAARRSGAGPRG